MTLSGREDLLVPPGTPLEHTDAEQKIFGYRYGVRCEADLLDSYSAIQVALTSGLPFSYT